MPKLVLAFSPDEINATGYQVIVERWDRLNTRKRLQYNMEFSPKERAYLSANYKKLYNWYLVTGVPQEVQLAASSYDLIRRAAAFFSKV